MSAIIWVLEICVEGKWQPRFTAPSLDESSALRSFFDSWSEECPGLPRRIKAYVRYSDVVDRKRAIERAIAWAEGPESKWSARQAKSCC